MDFIVEKAESKKKIEESKDNVLYLGKGQKVIVKDHFGTFLGEIENTDK